MQYIVLEFPMALSQYSSVSQTMCRGTLVCHEASIDVPRNVTIINKRLRKILIID